MSQKILYLVKRTAHGGSYNEAQAKESLQTGERCGDIIGKFFRNNSETSCQKRRVPHRLHNSDHERQNYEGIVAIHFIQQAKEYGTRSRSQDTTIE
jgi:hypothetical protein